ncbi:hypothetical protein [Methylophaga sp. OBS4]|uniref:hypothetical protein n=1 Tax=Methylophaga sp. OBS4 TaxID=2991935 RepID=UPI0022538490|nr:hypothetical protein [Methylophaga sp. OBS4]MCX4187827.1 hypothetical protein [Methylophaga sp. OBS4]
MKPGRNGLLYLSASLIFGSVLLGLIVFETKISFVKTFAPFISVIIALCLTIGALIFLWWFLRDIIWIVIHIPKAFKGWKEGRKQVRLLKRNKEILQKLDAISCDNSLTESQKTLKTVELFKDYGLAKNSTTNKPSQPTANASAE